MNKIFCKEFSFRIVGDVLWHTVRNFQLKTDLTQNNNIFITVNRELTVKQVDLNSDNKKNKQNFKINWEGEEFFFQNLLNLAHLTRIQISSLFSLQELTKFLLTDNITIHGIACTPMALYLSRKLNFLPSLAKTHI